MPANEVGTPFLGSPRDCAKAALCIKHQPYKAIKGGLRRDKQGAGREIKISLSVATVDAPGTRPHLCSSVKIMVPSSLGPAHA